MPSTDILDASQLCLEKRDAIYTLPLISPSAAILDPLEYGMGFQRGETNEFIGSKSNRMRLQLNMARAYNDRKWTLVPEKEHLDYLVELWWNNLHFCPPEQRTRYTPPEQGLCVSKSGRTFYPYSLYRLESFPIYTPDGTLTQSGTTRVWSSIPPYMWLVIANRFLSGQFTSVRTDLGSQKFNIRAVYDMVQTPLPSIFISIKPQPQRPLPFVKTVVEEQSQDVLPMCPEPPLSK